MKYYTASMELISFVSIYSFVWASLVDVSKAHDWTEYDRVSQSFRCMDKLLKAQAISTILPTAQINKMASAVISETSLL
jgi:hypothetical protein